MTTNRAVRPNDIPAMVALINANLIAQWGKPDWSEATAEAEFSSLDFDMERQTRLWFDAEGKLIATGLVFDGGKPSVRPQLLAYIHPDCPDYQEVGREIFAWGECVACDIAFSQSPPEAKVIFRSRTAASYIPNVTLFTALGMQKIRQMWIMETEVESDIPQPHFPDGFIVRHIRYPGESRALYHLSETAFADHYGHISDPEDTGYSDWLHEEVEASCFDPSLWYVVEYEGAYAGFVWCHAGTVDDPYMGWVDTLGVVPPYRHRGLGMALLRFAFHALQARGMQRVGLVVDSESLTGATRLYERAGMRATSRWDTYAKVLREGVDLMRQ